MTEAISIDNTKILDDVGRLITVRALIDEARQAEREATLAEVEDALAHAWGDDGLPDWIETELANLSGRAVRNDS